MKIAVCSKDENEIDERFGRCRYFQFFEVHDDSFKKVAELENPGKDEQSGAGIKAVETVAGEGAGVVIAGKFGPKAERALNEMGITPYICSGKIDAGLKNYLSSRGKRVFVPLLDNNGRDSRISPHFGHAPYFALIADGKPGIFENELDHGDPSKTPVDQVVEMANPDVVVAKKMGRRAIRLFTEKNIELKEAVGETLKDVLADYNGLPALTESCGH